MPFKLSNLNSNLALTLDYLNPALNNSAQSKIFAAFVLYSSAKQRLRIWKMNLKGSRIITTKAETIA